ncbi:DUF928 domain-containing protein [Lyngbya aestuarii]|uniref:DUF928 domain-containing protein n=1 Tax=Lyngbya aestuarii TaxID=118322 RepID=UPI00403E2B3E
MICKSTFWGMKLICGIAVFISLISNPLEVEAQSTNSKLSTVQFNRPNLSNRGAPGNREQGGSRNGSQCPALEREEAFTALVPRYKTPESLENVWGLTTAASPNFWFYAPYEPTEVQVGELILWDETDENSRNHQKIYQGTFTLNNTPGVISLRLPSTVKLERTRNYHWYVSIPVNCNSRYVSVDINGWIEREELETAIPISLEPLSRKKVIIYAKNGFWNDALTLLAQLRANDPENETLAADWAKLLGDVELGHLGQKNIVPCCTLEQSKI